MVNGCMEMTLSIIPIWKRHFFFWFIKATTKIKRCISRISDRKSKTMKRCANVSSNAFKHLSNLKKKIWKKIFGLNGKQVFELLSNTWLCLCVCIHTHTCPKEQRGSILQKEICWTHNKSFWSKCRSDLTNPICIVQQQIPVAFFSPYIHNWI